MKQKKSKMFTLFLWGVWPAAVLAQHSTNASGGVASGNGGSVSYSVGQVACSSVNGSSYSVIQGVQQPYEISCPTDMEDMATLTPIVSAYPNPTKDVLLLSIRKTNLKDGIYRLSDLNGALIESKKIAGCKMEIRMEELPPATYLLKVFEKNKEIGTFKIIKN